MKCSTCDRTADDNATIPFICDECLDHEAEHAETVRQVNAAMDGDTDTEGSS